MALDTRYRPNQFQDVIGQENTVKVLRQFVRSGTGFHQSYLFCGGHGSGKTTLGRILARALLCEAPVDGNPCDACTSCRSILDRGSNECFVEVDAATNSGKEDVKAITETLQFDTFSGRRRIYLFDEAHRLSKDALDALLKPMEDNAPGSDDKLLICIFCTTEPERMRTTIRSRCAPAFVIRPVSPQGIAERLAYVCEQEGITYEKDALVLVAEATECHIRDALKSVEGVAQLGTVSTENVRNYLRLNANALYLRILAYVGRDLAKVLAPVQELQDTVSPATAYERLAELAMLAYRTWLGVGKPPSYWPEKQMTMLGEVHGAFLVRMAQVFASKPGHPTFSMLDCDLSTLHFQRTGEIGGTSDGWTTPPPRIVGTVPQVSVAPSPVATPQIEARQDVTATHIAEPPNAGRVTVSPPVDSAPPPPPQKQTAVVTKGGVYLDPRGVKRREPGEKRNSEGTLPPIPPDEFKRGLRRLVSELAVDARSLRSSG